MAASRSGCGVSIARIKSATNNAKSTITSKRGLRRLSGIFRGSFGIGMALGRVLKQIINRETWRFHGIFAAPPVGRAFHRALGALCRVETLALSVPQELGMNA
jgi:hypothetical protein